MKTLLVFCLLTAPVMAQQTWDYTGAALYSLPGTPVYHEGPTTLEMTLAQPLGDNLNMATVTPVSYIAGWLNPGIGAPAQQFQFSTNAQGQITDWNIDIMETLPQNKGEESLVLTQYSEYGTFANLSVAGGGGYVDGVQVAAGTWVDPSSAHSVPELDWRGAGMAVTLLSGIALLINSLRRSTSMDRHRSL
jgi:hypothetical protein